MSTIVRRPPLPDLLRELSEQSVTRRHACYTSIDWDAAEHRIEPDDPRFELTETDPLGATDWYRSQPAEARARLGLHLLSARLRLGVDFEAHLCRGLLHFATSLPVGAPEFRYAYHEVIEESEHSMMFQEFVHRAGLPVRGLSPLERWAAIHVPSMGRRFPELFMIFVLAGESPIDAWQRAELKRGDAVHPLMRSIYRTHVADEARHLSFAHAFLRERAPRLSMLRRAYLRWRAPSILGFVAQQMMSAPVWLLREHRVPASVIRSAYVRNPLHQRLVVGGSASARNLLSEVGLLPGWAVPLWKLFGVWGDPAPIEEPA